MARKLTKKQWNDIIRKRNNPPKVLSKEPRYTEEEFMDANIHHAQCNLRDGDTCDCPYFGPDGDRMRQLMTVAWR